MRRTLFAPLLALALLPLPARADEAADKGYLTALLEDNLSGAGRQVVITGFQGALSSVATMDELTIADDAGIWITLKDVALDWSRSDLLSGAVTINSLTAGEILLDRWPQAESASLPSAEAAGFALPELPVSVDIGTLSAERIVLGAPILGEAVEATLSASMALAGGEGQAEISLRRIDDGPAADIAFQASYANSSTQLTLELAATEDANGIAARLLSIPGTPSTALHITGSGPLDAFDADVSLSTNGAPRLAGTVTLKGDGAGTRDFTADLAGDLAPVFWPQYASFLGSQAQFAATGSSLPDGRLTLDNLTLTAGAVNLSGRLALAPDGLPEGFTLGLRIAAADGQPVLLPLTTEVETRVAAADLNLSFDAAQGEAWKISGDISGLDRADFQATNLSLSGGGTIGRAEGLPQVSADMAFAAFGLAPASPALARALGPEVGGVLKADWLSGGTGLRLKSLTLEGQDYSLQAFATISDLASGFATKGLVSGTWQDLSRLSDLAGYPLAGAAKLSIAGTANPLGGAFDLSLAANGEAVALGQANLDTLLQGASTINANLLRDETGTTIRAASIAAADLTATLSGKLTSQGSHLDAVLTMPRLAALGGGFQGSLQGAAVFDGDTTTGRFSLNGTGNDLGIGQAEIDRILKGPATLALTGVLANGVPQLEDAQLDGQSLSVTANGTQSGTAAFTVTARLANLGLIIPEFPGPLTLSGPVVQDSQGTSLTLQANGPAGIGGSLSGSFAPGFATANLAFSGQSAAALANPFLKPRALSGALTYDLRLNGPLSLNSLSGNVSLANGTLSDPSQTFGFTAVAANATLGGGQAQIRAEAQVSTGGSITVQGNTGLALPFNGALDVVLTGVRLRDTALYDTTTNGQLTITGPLAGGALVAGTITLDRTELRIPSTGLTGAEPIPDITHLNEPQDVHETRARAGLFASTAAANSHAGLYPLDIRVLAPNKIFLRGRGLDAELGGSLQLRGTTANILPGGSFELIRGRLDILGHRLVLSQAQLLMQGALEPRIDVLATTESDGVIASVQISGPALNPDLSFTSDPALPEEEVLAQLLFGKNLQNLSAFQAAQMAGAVATLAGRGGEGLIGRLRKKSGLDNLDIQTSDTGETQLTAGKYLSDKVYTEVTVDQTGKTQIDLNLDIKSHITLKGKLDSDGNTGLGLFLEKNY